MVAAINRTLKDEMARNPRIVVFGEDVADCSRADALAQVPGKGGVFKVTHGLQRAFGSDRVFNSPLAEANIIGRAVGMATRGLKPVVEIQFFDYIWPAMMQIRDEMSMLRYRSNNAFSCPMVIRVPIGGYLRGGAPYHSQSGESIFAHCPGIRIVFPSNAAGRRRPAAHGDPLRRSGALPRAQAPLPPDLQQGRVSGRRLHDSVRQGRRRAAKATTSWSSRGARSCSARCSRRSRPRRTASASMVIDLRTIMPFDWDAIAARSATTNRVVIAHEDQLTCGFGAELAARIAGELFEYLDAPVRRVAALDTPVAYYPDLEEAILPQSADVLKAIKETAALLSAFALRISVAFSSRSWHRRSPTMPQPETLRSVGGLPAHIAGRFTELTGCRQTADGSFLVFDRRSHTVFSVERAPTHRVRSSRSAPKPGAFFARTRSTSPPTARSSSPTRRRAADGCSSSSPAAPGWRFLAARTAKCRASHSTGSSSAASARSSTTAGRFS